MSQLVIGQILFGILVHAIHLSGASDHNEKFEMRAEWKRCPSSPASSYNMKPCRSVVNVVFKIKNKGKTPTKDRFFKINQVEDQQTGEELFLFNPLVVRIKQDQVSLAYPLKYLHSVNNKVYELILHKDNTEKYTGCDDSLQGSATCGYSYHRGKVVKDSQGFCCPCDDHKENEHYHVRGGQDCSNNSDPDGIGDRYHSSAHCLRFDPLWYSVYSLGVPRIHHDIHLNVYREIDVSAEERDWVSLQGHDGIEVGTEQTSFIHRDKKVGAQYAGFTSHPNTKPINFKQNRLLVPQPSPGLDKQSRLVQFQRDGSQFLVVSKDSMEPDGSQCNKIGVSYTAFQRQKNRCKNVAQSCLSNQPMHLWLHDEEKHLSNKSGNYWLSNFAETDKNPIVLNKLSGERLLTVHYQTEYWSHLTIDINADDLIVISPGSHAQIVEVVTKASDNHVEILVQLYNNALVSSAYNVRVIPCDYIDVDNHTHQAEVPPQHSHRFIFSGTLDKDFDGDVVKCKVQVSSSSNNAVAERNLYIRPWDRCLCIAHCKCKCQSSGLVCDPLSQYEFMLAGFGGVVPSSLRHGIISEENQVDLVVPVVLASLLACGVIKALIGLLVSSKISMAGLCLFTYHKRLDAYFEKELQGLPVLLVKGHPVHPITKKPVRMISENAEVLLNVVFFFYLPFIWIHWLVLRCQAYAKQAAYSKIKENSGLSSNDDFPPVSKKSSDSVVESKYKPVYQPTTENNNNSATDAEKKLALEQYRKQKDHLKKFQNVGRKQTVGGKNNVEESRPSCGELENSSAATLSELTKPGQEVYFNFRNFRASKYGKKFSLCGTLDTKQENHMYVFNIDKYPTQVAEIVRGKKKMLNTRKKWDKSIFQIVLTVHELNKHITLEPLYICLNKE